MDPQLQTVTNTPTPPYTPTPHTPAKMGKTAKPKTRRTFPLPPTTPPPFHLLTRTEISTHSRAARRAASPSLDAPTAAKPSSLRTRSTSPSTPKTAKPHVLAANTHSGIKKSSKSKPLKRAQRLRQLSAAERAESNQEKFALKVAKSLGREKKVKERRKGWEDINEAKRKKAAKANAFGALGEDDEGEDKKGGGEWETLGDEVMDGADVEGVNEDAKVVGVDVDVDVDVGAGLASREDPQPQAMPLPDDVDPDL